jgi:hypothetical protein
LEEEAEIVVIVGYNCFDVVGSSHQQRIDRWTPCGVSMLPHC